MRQWFRWLLGDRERLIRPQGVGRPRSYSADSGYVYVYSFAGFRRVGRGVEYVFDVTPGRAPAIQVAVTVREDWLEKVVVRESGFTASERYGVAKVALKRALDAADHPAKLSPAITPGEAELREISGVLDL